MRKAIGLFLCCLLIFSIFNTGLASVDTDSLETSSTQSDDKLKLRTVGNGTTTPIAGDWHDYDYNEVVPISADAESGYVFSHWEGHSNDGDINLVEDRYSSDTSVTIQGTVQLVAVFKQVVTLTIETAGDGAGWTDPPGPVDVLCGETVMVTAYAEECSEFSGWTGDIESGAECVEVELNCDMTIIANFDLLYYHLAFDVDGHGWIESTVSQGSVTCGTAVDLTAYPDPCQEFDYWSGLPDGVATDSSSVHFDMDGDYTNIVAHFIDSEAPLLTVIPVGDGMGSTNPASPISMPCGQAFEVIAQASPCSVFVQWEEPTGGVISTNASHMFTIEEDTTVHARFEPNDAFYDVSWTSSGEGDGTILSNVEAGNYPCGTVIELTAEPAMCSEFSHWSELEGATVSGSTIMFPLLQDTVAIATFDLKGDVTLTVETAGDGNYEVSTMSVTVACGGPVTVTASPGNCTLFEGWTGAPDDATYPDPYTIQFDLYMDRTITANFMWDSSLLPTLTIMKIGEGDGIVSPASAVVPCDEPVRITAEPYDCSIFDGWSATDGGVIFSNNPDYMYEMGSEDETIYANFSLNPDPPAVPISVMPVGEGEGDAWFTVGDSIETATAGMVTCGSTITLYASPAACSYFVGWYPIEEPSWFDSTSEATVEVDIMGALDVVAVFEPIWYELTIDTIGDGTTDPSDSLMAVCGSTVAVVAIPDDGESFEGWSGDTDGAIIDGDTIIVTMDDNKGIIAEFTEPSPPSSSGGGGPIIRYTLSINIEGNGTVDPFVGSQTYNPGTVVDLSAAEAEGWTFVGWFGEDGADVVDGQIEMDDNKSITAVFETGVPLTTPDEPDTTIPEIEIPLEETPLGDGDLPYTGDEIPWLTLALGFTLTTFGYFFKKDRE